MKVFATLAIAGTAAALKLKQDHSTMQDIERMIGDLHKTADWSGNGKVSKEELEGILHALGGEEFAPSHEDFMMMAGEDGEMDMQETMRAAEMMMEAEFGGEPNWDEVKHALEFVEGEMDAMIPSLEDAMAFQAMFGPEPHASEEEVAAFLETATLDDLTNLMQEWTGATSWEEGTEIVKEFEEAHFPEDAWSNEMEDTYWWGFDDGYWTANEEMMYYDDEWDTSSDDDWWFDEETGDWWYYDYATGEWLMEDNSWDQCEPEWWFDEFTGEWWYLDCESGEWMLEDSTTLAQTTAEWADPNFKWLNPADARRMGTSNSELPW